MAIEQAKELVKIIDNLKKKKKKVIINHVWVKYILGVPNSDNTYIEIINGYVRH